MEDTRDMVRALQMQIRTKPRGAMANTRIGRAVLIRYIQSHGVLIIRALYLQRYAQRRPAMRRRAADRSPDNEVDERANNRSTRFGQLRKTLRGTIARESCAEQLRRTILLNVINGGLMPSVMFVNIAALMPDGRPLTPVVWLAIQHDWDRPNGHPASGCIHMSLFQAMAEWGAAQRGPANLDLTSLHSSPAGLEPANQRAPLNI